MKHIKFTFAEPIVGIQYVHDEVFPTGERELSISSRVIRDRLYGVLMDLHVPLCPRPRRSNECGYYKITLKDDYYFGFTNGEIFVMHGYDDLYIVDALGNKVNDDKADSDFDIDKVYSICK